MAVLVGGVSWRCQLAGQMAESVGGASWLACHATQKMLIISFHLLICCYYSQEREEQTAKLMQERLTQEAEAKRLAAESARREEERIRREMEARELEEARALLLEVEKRKGKKGKKNLEVGGDGGVRGI